jgi:hypothetical protein
MTLTLTMTKPMEKKQTAVEWMFDKLLEEGSNGTLRWHLKYDIFKILEEAKAMEKEQIIDSFDEARTYVLKNVWKHDDGIRYYENKYGEEPNRS